MNTDLVSIIVPVYNASDYLCRCVDSLLFQDYSDLEIVLVDDGSTDGSSHLCDSYADQYAQIKVIHQKNAGASIARKKGIEVSKGAFLMFVDSDDYVSVDYVSLLYTALKEYDADMTVCSQKRVFPGYVAESKVPNCVSELAMKNLYRRFFKYEFWGMPGGCYKREFFSNVIFPEATINEDYYIKAQLFTQCKKVVYVSGDHYFYEYHEGSLSHQRLSLRALGEFDNAEATWTYMKEFNRNFALHALSIVSEVSCKWLGTINRWRRSGGKDDAIMDYVDRIRTFVRKNFTKIVSNPHLSWKIKVYIVWEYARGYEA